MLATRQLTSEITSHVNKMSTNNDEFIDAMAREHRTLQQSFTRLCLQWIEYVGSPDYETDLRNAESWVTCKDLLDAYRRKMEDRGWSGVSLDRMSKPSEHLPII